MKKNSNGTIKSRYGAFFRFGLLFLSLQLLWLATHSVTCDRVTMFFPPKVYMILFQKVLVFTKFSLCMFMAAKNVVSAKHTHIFKETTKFMCICKLFYL